MENTDVGLARIINEKALRIKKGYYYYSVPTTVRRSGEMKVSAKAIARLIKAGLITESQLPQQTL